jgi:hypothetical protein
MNLQNWKDEKKVKEILDERRESTNMFLGA